MNRTGVAVAALLTLPNLDRARIGLDSVDGRVGDLRLLGVSVASPGTRGSLHIAGDGAALLLTIANGGEADDELTGASAEVAEAVVLRDGDQEAEPRLEVPVPAGGVAALREDALRQVG